MNQKSSWVGKIVSSSILQWKTHLTAHFLYSERLLEFVVQLEINVLVEFIWSEQNQSVPLEII